MPTQLDWTLQFPIQEGVLPDDTLIVKSRGTSGAGQFEVAGSARNPEGDLIRSRDLIGRKLSFILPAPHSSQTVRLSEEYPIQEVGGKVRISVQREGESRPNIGNLFAAAFMLPDVSSRAQSLPFADMDLGEKTYWIDDVSCRIAEIDDTSIVLKPEAFIFATSNKNDSSQLSMMAKFDFSKRLSVLYDECKRWTEVTNSSVNASLSYYLDFLSGKAPFEYEMASFMKSYVMKRLEEVNTDYERGADPLPYLCSGAPEEAVDKMPRSYIDEPHNLIYFGAPGTGKSYELNKLAEKCFPGDNVSRVTFYPDYTYSQFVGCFKPITEHTVTEDGTKETAITYRYVYGPFLETYVEACKHPGQNYLLIVEEINRANPAAVFGDVFQLLDRRPDGRSEYTVVTPEEMRDQLTLDFSKDGLDTDRLVIPSNMYIWATMNSADQGVFPMDTAFKRRWDFRYMGINEGEDAIIDGTPLSEITVPCGGREVVWNDLRHAINQFMLSDDLRINEDKLLGPFFIAPSSLMGDKFNQVFKDKILLYLYEDAGKMKRSGMFRHELKTYSEICDYFDEHGEGVFGQGFDDYFVFDIEDDDAAEA